MTQWLCLLRHPVSSLLPPPPLVLWQMRAESVLARTPRKPACSGAHPRCLEDPGRCRAQMALSAR